MPEWVFIDMAILKAARERKGLSYETMARELPVSAKTWERYEKAGRVPRPNLARVAEILDLEIEEPARERVVVRTVAIDDGELAKRLKNIERLMTSFDRKLDTEIVPRLDRLASQSRDRVRDV